MEKIWIKKELYILRYDFLKFMPFSDFIWFLNEFLKHFLLKKITKRESLPVGADVVSGSSGELTCGARDHRVGATRHYSHVAELGWPARGAGGVDAWQEAMQTGPRGRPWGAPRGVRGFACGGPTGIVGPSNSVGGGR